MIKSSGFPHLLYFPVSCALSLRPSKWPLDQQHQHHWGQVGMSAPLCPNLHFHPISRRSTGTIQFEKHCLRPSNLFSFKHSTFSNEGPVLGLQLLVVFYLIAADSQGAFPSTAHPPFFFCITLENMKIKGKNPSPRAEQ